MSSRLEFARRVLPGLWAGVLLCIALIATPAPFATLATHDAGRVVSRMFAQEAMLSLVLGIVLLLLERRAGVVASGPRLTGGMLMALGTLFCTVAGYYAVQPLMAAAREGQGTLSFGQLHAISFGLFGVKMLLALALAVKVARSGA